jgi:hypothetical protein
MDKVAETVGQEKEVVLTPSAGAQSSRVAVEMEVTPEEVGTAAVVVMVVLAGSFTSLALHRR